jgi:uncharacterized membrane protein
MRQNTFYLMAGVTGLVEVGIFWLAVQLRNPFLIMVSFIIGFVFLYALWRQVSDRKDDERAVYITEKAKSRTLDVFWVIFFALSLGSAVIGFSTPLHIPPPNPALQPDNFRVIIRTVPPDRPFMGYFGLFQLILLFLLILIYLVFRIYYSRKYGDWDSDEE